MLLVRRYIFPSVLTVTAYFILSILFKTVTEFFWIGLIFTVLFSYLMRVCDDFLDFEKDFKNNKVLLSKKALLLLVIAIISVLLCGIVAFREYIFFLPLGIILSQFLLRGKLRSFVKVLFVPAILAALFHTAFKFSYFSLIPICLSAVLDICLIIKKGECK